MHENLVAILNADSAEPALRIATNFSSFLKPRSQRIWWNLVAIFNADFAEPALRIATNFGCILKMACEHKCFVGVRERP